MISGGGRCNVTNTIWEPETLVKHYPRGNQHLLEPFKQFNSKHTQDWFNAQGVELKTESDGRVFPVSDDSSSIANALLQKTKELGIDIKYGHRATSFEQKEKGWIVQTNQGAIETNVLVITTGGSPAIWKTLEELGLAIVAPVPSLFTFHCIHEILEDLPGISFPNALVTLLKDKSAQSGPILITHEGLSGPAILKLSAWSARQMCELNYKFDIQVNWLGVSKSELIEAIKSEQEHNPKKHVLNKPVLDIPKRFWIRVCELSGIPNNRNYAEIGKKQIQKIITCLLECNMHVSGKSTNKDEFVTAGGVDLSEINFNNFSCKQFSNLYMAGEVIDIDAVTGGFNFQAAWTGGYIIGKSIKV